MCSKTLFVIFFVFILLDCSNGQRNKKFFRKDYTFLESTNSFYKIHTIQRSWAHAKKTCKQEGATFYYAENDDEANVVLDFWHQTQPLARVYVGISDLVAKGVFETYDVFIHLYKFIKDVGKCFKFHNTALTWTEAYAVCSAEQAYLAVINNQVEADYLELLANIPGHEQTEAVHLGFHNRAGDGWQTVRGSSLEDSGYVRWGQDQPDGGGKQLCGSMFYNGRLNDISCDAKCHFVCESIE